MASSRLTVHGSQFKPHADDPFTVHGSNPISVSNETPEGLQPASAVQVDPIPEFGMWPARRSLNIPLEGVLANSGGVLAVRAGVRDFLLKG